MPRTPPSSRPSDSHFVQVSGTAANTATQQLAAAASKGFLESDVFEKLMILNQPETRVQLLRQGKPRL